MADLTTKEVALRFGLQDAAVRNWCRRGLFPNAYEEHTPRGNVWRIPARDLEGFSPPKMGRPPKPRKEEAA